MNPDDIQKATTNLQSGVREITGLTYGEAMALQSALDETRKEEIGTDLEGRTPETRVCPDGDEWKVRLASRYGRTG